MTHINNIQALGNKMVDNLNTMGVSANFNDGALTLADKILDIETTIDYSYILLLYADTKIISRDETLELYALYLEDRFPVSNETITFTIKNQKDEVIETLTSTTNTNGIANASYLAQGIGDLNIQASTNNNIIQSSIYQVEDCIIYDPTQYMLPNNWDGKRYTKNVADCSNNCYMSMIGKRTGGTQYIWQAGFSISDSELSENTSHNWIAQGGHYTARKGMFYLDQEYRVDGTTVNNREYLYEVILIDNDLTFIMTDLTDNTQVYNQTIHIAEDLTGKYLQLMRMGNPSWYYRELKFKLLPDNKFLKLDGTETKTQISGPTSISNGVMSGGASYITSSKIDNSKDWEVTLDAKFSGNGCGVWLIKSGTTVRDRNRLIFVNNKSTADNKSGFLLVEDGQSQKSAGLDIRYPNYNTYTSCLFKKQGDTYSVTLDDTYTMTLSAPTFVTTCPELCVGVDSWGATCSIKNVKMRYI